MRKREPHELKDSGVEWLGEVPASWEISKLKNVFSERKEKSKKDAIHLTPSQKYGTLPQTEYMKVSGSKPVLVLSENATFKQVYKNDFISHLRSFQGGLEITNYEGKISPAYTVITPSDSYEPRYLKHLLKSVRFIELLNTTTAQMRDGQSIKWKQLSNLEIPVPPIEEQLRISTYLDAEFNKIDALVEEFAKFKSNLQLQKRSLISECVTKGLPSERNRAYKDSGVEWLGEVPVSWGISKVKYIGSTIMGGTPDSSNESYWGGGVKWATPVDINDDKYIDETKRTITQKGVNNSSAKMLPINSIIISTRAPIGSIAINTVEMSTNQGCKSLIVNKNTNTDYIYYYLQSIKEILNYMGTGTTFLELSTSSLKSLNNPLPLLDEQKRIASYLDAECAKIDSLTTEIDNQSNLLKTYRKSLINEVVTGKFEV